MGVKNFTLISDSAVFVNEKKLKELLKNKTLAIDASCILYSYSLGTKNTTTLTDESGESTVFINTLLNVLAKHKDMKIKESIYVFDNPMQNPNKIEENKRRKTVKSKTIEKIEKNINSNEEKTDTIAVTKETDISNDIETEIGKNAEIDINKDRLSKAKFGINEKIVSDMKFILNCLGVPWIEVNDCNYEAEHLCAQLTIDGVADYVYTQDSDALLFGAVKMIRKCTKKTLNNGDKIIKNCKKLYEVYELDKILKNNEIERKDLIKAGVILGTDFSKKTKGIGPKTVLKKLKQVDLTEEQKKAINIFNTKIPYDKNEINRSSSNKDKLIDWLVNGKGFNVNRVEKMLKFY